MITETQMFTMRLCDVSTGGGGGAQTTAAIAIVTPCIGANCNGYMLCRSGEGATQNVGI